MHIGPEVKISKSLTFLHNLRTFTKPEIVFLVCFLLYIYQQLENKIQDSKKELNIMAQVNQNQ